jgi:hypothetical protein
VGLCPPACVVDELPLERGEEALDHGVVPAVAPPTNAAPDPGLSGPSLLVAAGVLSPAI